MKDLSPREREVAALVAEGLLVREIAQRLGISAQTVKNHKVAIYAKYGVRNSVELTLRLLPAVSWADLDLL